MLTQARTLGSKLLRSDNKQPHHQLEIKLVLDILPPLLRPTLPSPISKLQRRSRQSLSLPSILAQSFHSRRDSLNFSRIVSTNIRSSVSVQSPSSGDGEDQYAESSSDCRPLGLLRGMSSSTSSVGASSARKSSAERPSGIDKGILRRLLGVRTGSGVRGQSSMRTSRLMSCSNSLRRRLFAFLFTGCCCVSLRVCDCCGSSRALPNWRDECGTGCWFALGAPRIAWSVRQLEESGPGRAFTDRWGWYALNDGSLGRCALD
jgi:hypothetical protein